ncbi:2Fe-2S iron-sulfur cluster-binding protein [Pseudonocardia broussonetiae]|uniref:2Fe-2S iron-sulfur cluster binding domain-containing protein n=1 Tax=Pseudonocardia broussonetiae TaxID=2736640 RepID=A0A6M6JMD8_9PSEU|nr:2Fe-2S iron-sulfur cluster-binding protein [Pseudonocardia broussonetiae]QJY48107.1 2Fe-2S iron-sulfur cluster binding domain-containing protein [Pseudonocardia broussonetiae]
MPTITFRQPDGAELRVDAPVGTSVMKSAVGADVPGILAECGGQAMCATCHVYVTDDRALPPVSDEEDEMLDCASAPRTGHSRLSCQLVVDEDMDGLTVLVAGEGP